MNEKIKLEEPEKVEDIIPEQKLEEKKPEEVKEPKEENYINKEEALEKLIQIADLNNVIIWMAATMSLIAAINSLTGPTVMTKCLVFMIIGLISLIIYKRRFKK